MFSGKKNGIVIGIDASRNRSGGAKAHLIGILTESNPQLHGISEVHLWSYKDLLDKIPDYPWLKKHCPPELQGSLLSQIKWQYFVLAKELKKNNCDILFKTDGGNVCTFKPSVVMSRDMLSFEKKESRRYKFSLARLRILILYFLQANSFRKSTGVIFLTQYAAQNIQKRIGKVQSAVVIPHGVTKAFRQDLATKEFAPLQEEIRCLYISDWHMYKHPWIVVKAIVLLRSKGYNLSLSLVGRGYGKAKQLLEEEVMRSDPAQNFVKVAGPVAHEQLPVYLARADVFIFASSCENMPNILLEAMASGLPIACSDRGPMPEVLQDGGVYFDPENAQSIATAVEKILYDHELRSFIAKRAKEFSQQYSWEKCGQETWDFLVKTVNLVQ